mmetsp:Transcript_11534/g.6888  ORF Transcript_11534/g.6888 Transcript_11534/m.6888 type:complete len:103 (+) Transcript_11534:27-335(+)
MFLVPPSLQCIHSNVLSPSFIFIFVYLNYRLFNLAETCGEEETQVNAGQSSVSTSAECRCDDAERKIANGFITCGVDVCPDGCTVCDYCLSLLDCEQPNTNQ